jgi:hypothetical protein
MDQYFLQKTVVITGGASGIGFGIAGLLADEGAHIFILGRETSLSPELHLSLVERNSNCRVEFVKCDIADTEQVKSAAETVGSRTKSVDLLINNAGYATYQLFCEIVIDEAVRLAQTNFTGHVAVTSSFLPLIRSADRGQICFVSSIAAELPITPNSVYAAAKRGMEGLAIALRQELLEDGITVTSVFPGRIVTPFFDHPTFTDRIAGNETRLTTPLDGACAQIVLGLKKRKTKIFVPLFWRFVAFIYRVDPIVSGRMFNFVISRRLNRLRSQSLKTKRHVKP